MGRSKDAWLRDGAGDLKTAVIEDVPVKGESILVRALPAAYSNKASTEATELRQVGRDQILTVDRGKLEQLQFKYGVVDPEFSLEEVERISQHFGPAFYKAVTKIEELSELDNEAITETHAKFPVDGEGEGRTGVDSPAANGSAGPDIPVRASAQAGKDDSGDDDG